MQSPYRMKSILLFFLVVSQVLGLSAQIQKVSVTLQPFSVIDTDAGIMPGVGYAINKHFAVFADVGIIFFTPYTSANADLEINGRKGINFKPALRYYFKEATIQSNGYVELEGLFKYVRYNGINDVAIVDENGNFAYNYIGGYKINKNVIGASFKMGHRNFFKRSANFGYDVFLGFGVRRKSFERTGLPAGAQPASDPFFRQEGFQTNVNWTRGNYPYFPMGIKLFYNL